MTATVRVSKTVNNSNNINDSNMSKSVRRCNCDSDVANDSSNSSINVSSNVVKKC